MNSLVNNVLRFGRPARLTLKRTRLATILDNVLTLVKPQAQEQNVQVELQDLTQGAEIMVDAELLNSCFSNLAINAIQAIPSDRQGQIRVSVVRKGEYAIVQISDNGGGIPPEIRERVFEPNFTTKTSGSGLGLAISRQLVELMGGHIGAESAPGSGSIFRFTVPLQQRIADSEGNRAAA